jgi:hypothetical protein
MAAPRIVAGISRVECDPLSMTPRRKRSPA